VKSTLSLALLWFLAGGTGQSERPAPALDSPAASSAIIDWPLFRGTRGLLGVAPGALPEEPELLWTFETAGAVTSSPVIADGRVYFGSDDAKLHCVDAATGEALWAFATEDMIEAPPMVVDGSVYIGSNDFFLYALDAASGELRWKFETGDKILGGANHVQTEAGLCIVVCSYDASLYGIDAKSGKQLWQYVTDNYVNGTPAVDGERTCFGGCDAVLHVVSVQTGKRLAAIDLGADSHVAGSAAIEDGRAYFGHYGNQFVCIDLATQKEVWHYDSPRFAFFSSPAIGADRVVFGGRDKQLHCVAKSDGAPIWTFKTGRKVDGSPVICGDEVVFGSGDGRLYILGLEDGKARWSHDIGKALISSPAVADGKIFIGCNDSKLYVFGDRRAASDDK